MLCRYDVIPSYIRCIAKNLHSFFCDVDTWNKPHVTKFCKPKNRKRLHYKHVAEKEACVSIEVMLSQRHGALCELGRVTSCP